MTLATHNLSLGVGEIFEEIKAKMFLSLMNSQI